ncbi:SET domain-containing protein [Oceanobacillus chungangensis]|uniref:SET domain-containing protein-lysine N-methyltransferase n=1 Tax=Oceanobacillus chungangensis TaxID=1229152 RepID=A0A3D8PVS3_9BACI|nr:SET domain-containing protein [Oceanobacillus chungangensis]RDW19647.1 SET domain-containing protein-lysine N-methyltransferase [Oceanobacillus chungangensis]
MMYPHTKLYYINDQIGFGVFATKFIPKGTITWALDELDHILEPEFVAKLDKHRRKFLNKYTYRNRNGQYILCWDLGRYVNHSFHANCMGTAYDFEIAIRDILPGEQLTSDYGTLNIGKSYKCIPEEGTDRERVNPNDLLHYYKEWDQQVIEALKHFNDVEQPLIHLIQPDFKEKVMVAAKENILLDSIKSNFYDRSSKRK